MKRHLGLLTLLVATLFTHAASGGRIFVGSWNAYHANAPDWHDSQPDGLLAYTAQEAAALLYGGNPGDYSVSTIDDQIADINNMAWYDVIGCGGKSISCGIADNYFVCARVTLAGTNLWNGVPTKRSR